MRYFALAFLLVLILILTGVARAEWSHDPSENLRVPGFAGDAYSARISSPGNGQTIVVWVAAQGSDMRIFAQRFDSGGERLWGSTGLQVADPSRSVVDLKIVDDANGGVFVCWREAGDEIPAYLYAQRVTFQGNLAWAAGGVRVCTFNSEQAAPRMLPDGAAGLYVVWHDGEAPNVNVYGARLDPSGNHLWNPSGLAICTVMEDQWRPQITAAPGNGIYVAWTDYRDDPITPDVYAQRLSSAGSPQWSVNGVQLSDTGDYVQDLQAVTSSDGDLIIAWNGTLTARVQKVDPTTGAILWLDGGVDLPPRQTGAEEPAIVPVDDGGVIAIVKDTDIFVGDADILAHRVSDDGDLIWGPQGVLVAEHETDYLTYHRVTEMDDGTLGIVWQDHDTKEILAQRLGVGGQLVWPDGPRVMASGFWTKYTHQVVSLADNAIVGVWPDLRTGSPDVYIQYLDAHGFCGDNRPVVVGVADRPADQGGEVIVNWRASWLDGWPAREISRYTVWFQEHVDGRAPARAADEAIDVEALATRAGLPPARAEALIRDGWTFGLEVPAAEFDEYGAIAPTLADSSDAGWPWFEYLVIAHGQETWRLWEAEPVAGYSVDNLAPVTPAGLVVEYEYPEGVALDWLANEESDLRSYRIYGGPSEDFEIGPETLVHETSATQWSTSDPQAFYKLTAVDQHGNESPPANPQNVVGVAPDGVPASLALHSCVPNPFNPATTVRFDVPAPGGRVRLEIFDLTGRRVAVLADAVYAAGRHELRWSGTDDLGRSVSSGVYLARLGQGGESRTSKMVLAR
jgi:hypothetical protein